MRVELPVFKRCCCCLPLRRGLLFLAYITLIGCVFGLSVLAQSLHKIRISNGTDEYRPIDLIVFQSLRLILYIPDIVLTIMFIYGAHTKNYNLFRIYYFSMVALTAILLVLRIANSIWFLVKLKIGLYLSYYWILLNAISFIFLGMQVYLILMVRSEMIKLGKNCEFRFLNLGAEAECKLTTVQEVAMGERANEHEIEMEIDQ